MNALHDAARIADFEKVHVPAEVAARLNEWDTAAPALEYVLAGPVPELSARRGDALVWWPPFLCVVGARGGRKQVLRIELYGRRWWHLWEDYADRLVPLEPAREG